MLTLMNMGGPLMWLILALAVGAAAVFLERALHLHRARIKTDDFLRGIANILSRNNISEALTICDETPGPVSAITRAAIRQHQATRAAVQQAVEQTALTEIGRMENRAVLLSATAYLAPLLGLIGTVVGMIRMLVIIQQRAPLIHAGDLAHGAWQALLTTVAGIAVAACAAGAYSLIMAKIDNLALDMEQSAAEIISLVTTATPDTAHTVSS